MRPMAGEEVTALVDGPVRELHQEVGRSGPGAAVKLTRGAALVAMDAVDQPVSLFLGAADPLANTLEILLIDGGFERERLSHMEFIGEETESRALIKGFRPAGKPKLRLDFLVLLVAQLAIGLVQGLENIRRDSVHLLMTQGIDPRPPREIRPPRSRPRDV